MARSYLTAVNFNNIPNRNFTLELVATLPAVAEASLGRLVILSSTRKIYLGEGGSWKAVGSAEGLAIGDIAGLDTELGLKATKLALDALETVVAAKSPTGHTHLMTDITDLAARLTAIDSAVSAKAASTHTHVAASITDFNNTVDARIVAYFDATAGSDENLDTLREIIDLIKAHTGQLELLIGRYGADVGNGTLTTIPINHGLNSLDCSVEVFEKSTGATVLCDVVRTNANVVTLGFAVAPLAASLRIVIKV